MQLNHFAHRVATRHFDTIVDMLKENLQFVELRRGTSAIHMRQPGANVDLQFTRSDTGGGDADKRLSQVSFLSETPEAHLKKLAAWARARGLEGSVGSYSTKEFYLDIPEAFVDFVIEAMTPDCAEYDVKV